METTLRVPDEPSAEDREAVLAPLAAFNTEHGYPSDTKPLAVLLTDESGGTVGGLWGRTGYGWLFVEFLAVPDRLRGRDLGRRLMETAERLAAERGCVGAWLTTFGFQARPFYEKLGYEAFGELPHSPRDNVCIFMRKRFG